MPWESAINNLDFFYLMFDRSEVYGPMQVNVRSHPATPGAFRPFHISTMAQYFSVFLLDLPQATGETFVSTLQRFKRELDKVSRGTHGPVSTYWSCLDQESRCQCSTDTVDEKSLSCFMHAILIHVITNWTTQPVQA